MSIIAALFGICCVFVVLADAFETVVLPRTVMRKIRLSNVVFDFAGKLYGRIGRLPPSPRRQGLLVAFAPLILLILISLWAVLIIVGWALIHWGFGTPLQGADGSLARDIYFSGVTFFTLGYGDIVPTEGVGRMLSVFEAGLGFGFLALVVSYVPVLYNAFSRREVQMLLLDSRAGSQPMSAELLRRHAESSCMSMLTVILRDWERFGAELLESYLSYPILAYYRSQHDDSSWLKSLTAVMDTCALIEVGFQDDQPWMRELRFQARATFAMGRHVCVDLAYILDIPPQDNSLGRLPPHSLHAIRVMLAAHGVHLRDDEAANRHLQEVREMYEPYVLGLAKELVLDLPKWCDANPQIENWQTSAWEGIKHF